MNVRSPILGQGPRSFRSNFSKKTKRELYLTKRASNIATRVSAARTGLRYHPRSILWPNVCAKGVVVDGTQQVVRNNGGGR